MATDLPDELLRDPDDDEKTTPLERVRSFYNPLSSFELPKGEARGYKQQYADMYFLRLGMLKPAVEELAREAWSDFQIAGERVQHVDRVLDVRQGDLCWVSGTIFKDMPLKPNILDDLSKDHWLAAPPSREKYLAKNGQDLTMLEDESGRLRLVGTLLEVNMLVTGCIVSVMGTENADGEFEVVDLKVPDLARQPQRWERDEAAAELANNNTKSAKKSERLSAKGGKVAIISGLAISSNEGDTLRRDLLMEYLLGEACGPPTQSEVSHISRLIIAGNSISEGNPMHSEEVIADSKKSNKKYGYDSAAYNPLPIAHLDEFLATLLPSLPITILPGETDPANVSLPQQPIHSAMFPRSRNYGSIPDSEVPPWFDSVSNPWEGDIDGWRFLGNGGQPIDDVYKYVEGDERLAMMESLLRWRCNAPTAPDTLWCYPFQDKEQFVMEECPHVFFVGNQPEFDTAVIEGPTGQSVRLVSIPKFKETGEVVLLDTETLDVELVKFDIDGEM